MHPIESASLRHRVRHLLSTADVEPSSVGPSSIFIVRAMADPARGELQREPGALAASARWVRAARRELDAMYRRAARPAFGPVPASAPAVLFDDPAELLACLARDWLIGDMSSRWWWQAWLRATARSTPDLVIDAWARDARHAPAAMAALHDWKIDARFTGRLSAREARTVFVAVTEAFELPALAAPTPAVDLPVVAPHRDAPDASRRDRAIDKEPQEGAGPAPPEHHAQTPWEPWVPAASVPATLGVEHRTLLGVCLMLSRAPLAVRVAAFQRAFHTWRRAEQFRLPVARNESISTRLVAGEPRHVEPADAVQSIAATGDHVVPTATSEAPRSRTASGPEISAEAALGATPPTRFRSESADVSAPVEPGAVPSPAVGVDHRRSPRDAIGPAVTTADAAVKPREVVATHRVPAEVPSIDIQNHTREIVPSETARSIRPAEFVRTELGGVLFLINALQQLEVFDRLDDHFGVVSSIGAWGWLEIVARGLLGERQAGAAVDPIWSVLASLDGRRDDAPIAAEFRGPRSYRLPESWPVPADGHSHGRSRGRPLGLMPGDDLHRFLDTLIPYLGWRVLRAMALEAPSPEEEDALLASRLLYRRGRLTCTATHVDLHMSMAQVDIAVRLAGLDANPGWVPALGRVVTFYFEQE